MRKRARWVLMLSTWVLVLSGYTALATTRDYGPELVLLGAVLLFLSPVGELLDQRFRAYRYVTNTVTVLTSIVLVRVYLHFHLIDVVTWLVLYIQGFKLLHRKAQRDYYQIFLMSFFMLLSACHQEPEASIGLVMMVFLTSAVWAFVMLQVHVESEANGDRAVADIVPLDADQARVLSPTRMIRYGGLVLAILALCGGAMVASSALFLFTPRMEAGVLGRSNFAPTGVTALSRQVDLRQSGRLQPDTTPIMRVEFPDEPGGQYNGPQYWRSVSFARYSGTRWDRGARQSMAVRDQSFGSHSGGRLDRGTRQSMAVDDQAPVIEFMSRGVGSLIRTAGRGGHVVRQRIYLDDTDVDGLPCLAWVKQVDCRGAELAWDGLGDFAVQVVRKRTPSLQYEAVSEVVEPTPEELRKAPQDYERVFSRQDYARLTVQDLEPRSLEQGRRLTEGVDNVYDKVAAIQEWLEGPTFAYTLDIPELPAQHPVDAFLNQTRRGHCQLFASSMALLVRGLGIPARVASGYRGGEWSATDGAYIIRRSMAHLWVEVYFIDYGWIRFDPSPSREESLVAPSWLMSVVSRYMLRAKMVWFRDIVGYEGALSWFQIRDLAIGLVTFDSGTIERALRAGQYGASLFPFRLMVAGMVVAALVALVVSLGSGRGVPKRKSSPLTSDQRRALRLFRLLKRKFRRAGVAGTRPTAGDMLTVLRQYPRFAIAPVERVLDIYNNVRFGGRPLSARRYRRLRALIRSLRRM